MIPTTSNNYWEISEKNGVLCRPTIASALVAINVLWVAIRKRPFDLRIRVTVIAFYKRSIGKYYKMCPCRRSDMISTAAHETNDRIATQRYSSPKIPIGSRVMSRTTSAPSGRRSRKMVANVAGCRSFCTFRDCHTSIAFTPVGPQPNLAHIFGWIWD